MQRERISTKNLEQKKLDKSFEVIDLLQHSQHSGSQHWLCTDTAHRFQSISFN